MIMAIKQSVGYRIFANMSSRGIEVGWYGEAVCVVATLGTAIATILLDALDVPIESWDRCAETRRWLQMRGC